MGKQHVLWMTGWVDKPLPSLLLALQGLTVGHCQRPLHRPWRPTSHQRQGQHEHSQQPMVISVIISGNDG